MFVRSVGGGYVCERAGTGARGNGQGGDKAKGDKMGRGTAKVRECYIYGRAVGSGGQYIYERAESGGGEIVAGNWAGRNRASGSGRNRAGVFGFCSGVVDIDFFIDL